MSIQQNKKLAIFGVITKIISVFASAEDIAGNYTAPVALILISAIASLAFMIMAVIRLWKSQRITAILFLTTSLLSLFYVSDLINGITTLLFIWVIILLWEMAKHEGLFKKTFGKYGLTPEESSLVQEDLRKGDKESALQRFTMAQELRRASLLAQGIDPLAIICLIGQDIKWADIVRQVFRVLEFDRCDTIVLSDGTVKATTQTKPYGYLLVETPILNVKARLPIIHSGDFALATRVYDEPQIAELMKETELLVTYFPQHKLPMGLSGIMHPLHYVLVPRGTLERYYEFNNDEHMAKPAPEKLFKEFVWSGEVRVQVNPDPIF